jgi:peptide/nickel transport system substrate-binding protein
VPAEPGGDLVVSRRPPRQPRRRQLVPRFAGRRPGRLAVVIGGVLLVGLGLSARSVLSPADTDHHGGVLTMVGSVVATNEDSAAVTDVTLHWSEEFSRLAAVTNDGLVGFRRAGGVQGFELVPDLATTLPEPSDGGLTYTFQLRRGVRYSTGAPVLAGDIRRGIERTVAHPDSAPPYYTQAIVGAQSCLDAAKELVDPTRPSRDCDLHNGITANDRTGTITFHLTQPTPDFIYQLALPNASAVPQNTPLDLPLGAPLPATGPYMLRAFARMQFTADGHPRLELVRNPHFHVWSSAVQPDGYPNRIVLETGYTKEEIVARLRDGRADIAWSGVPQAGTDRLRDTHGSQMLLTTAGLNTNYVFLNTTKAPFNNLDARRAVAYALDRGALTRDRNAFSGPVTCQLLPPGLMAYHQYCPFTHGGGEDGEWTGPDPRTARELVQRSGTLGARVVIVLDNADPAPRTEGQRVAALLDRLGYRASLHVVSLNEFFLITGHPDADWNAGLGGWVADYPTASQFLVNLASCDPDLRPTWPNNLSRYCNPDVDKQMKAASAQQRTDPLKASHIWARIDRAVVDDAAIIPFGNNLRRDLVGSRVGNTLVHPMTGSLIAQMWVQ